MFNFLRKKIVEKEFTLERLVEMDLLSNEERLLLKKERAIKEWENWVKRKIINIKVKKK